MADSMAEATPKPVRKGPNTGRLIHQTLLSLIGAYAFTWGLSAASIAAQVALGVDFHEAETRILLLAFLVFIAVFMWAFACHSLARVWCVLVGGALGFSAIAYALQHFTLT